MFERDDRIGGLLRYGIPEFKMEKAVLDRRLRLMEAEGHRLQAGLRRRRRRRTRRRCKTRFDAVVLACGVPVGRDLPIPGRELEGIHFAMEYLPLQNKRCEGDAVKDEPVHHGARQARR